MGLTIHAGMAAAVPFTSGWIFHEGDSPVGAGGAMEWARDDVGDELWKSLPNLTALPGTGIMWLKTTIPNLGEERAALSIQRLSADLAVYVDGVRVYHYGDPSVPDLWQHPTPSSHFVWLGTGVSGKSVALRLRSYDEHPIALDGVAIGPADALLRGTLRDQLMPILGLLVIGMIGAGLLCAFCINARHTKDLYLGIGLVSLSCQIFSYEGLLAIWHPSRDLQVAANNLATLGVTMGIIGVSAFLEMTLFHDRRTVLRPMRFYLTGLVVLMAAWSMANVSTLGGTYIALRNELQMTVAMGILGLETVRAVGIFIVGRTRFKPLVAAVRPDLKNLQALAARWMEARRTRACAAIDTITVSDAVLDWRPEFLAEMFVMFPVTDHGGPSFYLAADRRQDRILIAATLPGMSDEVAWQAFAARMGGTAVVVGEKVTLNVSQQAAVVTAMARRRRA